MFYTLPRGSTCIMAQVTVGTGKSLVLSSSVDNGAMAVLSGGTSKSLFHVQGEVILVDLILEDLLRTVALSLIYVSFATKQKAIHRHATR